MIKLIMMLFLSVFFAYPSFADNQATPPDEASSPNCEAIAKACTDAGYTRDGAEGKMFWRNCMKPILFGKAVSGVSVDTKDVKACVKFKIKNMQEQINELKKHQ